MTLRTAYEFTLPRGYVDPAGRVHATGTMRLATARDELDPLRDPTVQGPDDPRLTILVLTRVIQRLGDLDQVTTHTVEGLFAVDLAFLQDFYGVINFGDQAEYDALVQAQRSTRLLGVGPDPEPEPEPAPVPQQDGPGPQDGPAGDPDGPRPSLRRSVEELPRRTS